MNRLLPALLMLLAGALSLGAAAETQSVANTTYNVQVEDGDQITTPGGTQVSVNTVSHGTAVNDATGETLSQWCTGESTPVEGGLMGAGYCTLIADNGDVFWVSYVLHGAEPATWTVMGGTGSYEGASGSGTTTVVSQRGDGEAWTSKSTGTITTR